MTSEIASRLQSAMSLHQNGQLDQAEHIYTEILRFEPRQFDALQLLATLAVQRRKFTTAIELFDRALKVNSNHAGSLSNRGIALYELGRFEEAVKSYDLALSVSPDSADALNNRGNALRALKRMAEALASFDRALEINPDSAKLLINRGIALQELHRNEEALETYDRALQVTPNDAEVLNRRGNTLIALNRTDEAVECYDRALVSKPNSATVLGNRGLALQRLRRNEEALECYDRALALSANSAELFNGRGVALEGLCRFDEAIASFDQALQIDSTFAESFNNRGNALRALNRPEEALLNYDQGICLNPNDADFHNNRGHVLRELGRDEDALESHNRAIAIDPRNPKAYLSRGILWAYQGKQKMALADCQTALGLRPDYPEARWALTMMKVPLIASSEADLASQRLDFAEELAALDTWLTNSEHDGEQLVGTWSPFYLAYQEASNRELLRVYGTLCCGLMKRWKDKQEFANTCIRPGEIRRVGIVSAHVKFHSVWNAIVKGWFRHLDPGICELHVFYVGPEQDAETTWARSHSASFEHGNRSLRQWVASILEKHLDFLVYPEIGMDSTTIKLASLRLAPVQIATWGHPETTGLPTIDYYLSAEAFEPPNAETHYTESLIVLPNLGCSYLPNDVSSGDLDLASLCIDPDGPILISPGTPFKYAPENDGVFVDIARQLGKCQIIFFNYQMHALSRAFQDRLESAFSRSGMDFGSYCVFIPWMTSQSFYALMKRAHVFLDPIGFSGFNTAMQAIECGLPIVTKEGRFMRGRLAAGILRRIGMAELVAEDNARYVEIATELARNRDYRQEIQRKLEMSRNILFDDVLPVRALENFFVNGLNS